jgi:mannose-1-phosphate guanylyltransferase
MLPVAGIPFTEHQIAKARAAGIEEIVLATSYRAEVFEPYFGNGEKFGISISYAVEESALGTGGAIANAAKLLRNSGPVVIFNGDVLSSHDLLAQIDLHISQNADVTLHLTEVVDARAFGVVELSGSRILTFNEKMENPPTNIINAGCYIFNREIIDSIPTDRAVSVERETFPQLIQDGKRLLGYVDSSYWLDIGTPAALLKANRDLIAGTATSEALDLLLRSGRYEIRDGSLISDAATIHPSARVEGGSLISPDVIIGEGALIHGSVIFSGARIGAEVSLIETFVAENCEIPVGFIAQGQFFGFLEQ